MYDTEWVFSAKGPVMRQSEYWKSELDIFQICQSPGYSASLSLLSPQKQVVLLENPPVW